MNKKLYTLAIGLFMGLTLFAQKSDHEKIKSLKIAFITEQLSLTSKEAERFWPLYNKYEEEKHAHWEKGKNEIFSRIKNPEELSEKEASDLLKAYIDFEYEEEKMELEFYKDMEDEITAKRTLLLIKADDDFKRQMIRQFHKRKGNGGR